MSATGGSTAPMYAAMFTNSISAVGTGISQSRAISAQGDYESSVANTNARLSELKANESLHAGDAEIARRNEETKLQTGAARAAAGASGTDVGSGSTARAIRSIGDIGSLDALTIKNNAARTAWGFQTQAVLDRFRGQMARLTAKSQSEQTLVTGGLRAVAGPLSTYSDYLRYSQRYDGRQGTPSASESEWQGMV